MGVQLSSSNAPTWTPHQTMYLSFRILQADFGGEADDLVDLGSAPVSSATEILLRSLAEFPASSCRCEYELALPYGTKITAADGQAISLGSAINGNIGVTARLSGDASYSPILYPGTQLISGARDSEGDYYARTISASGAQKATLIYDARIPSGATVKGQIQIDQDAWQDMEKNRRHNGR